MQNYELHRLRDFAIFKANLRFDVTPKFLFLPRYSSSENREMLIAETTGFMLYIESMEEPPSLMVMKTYNLSSKSIAYINGVPQELIEESIAEGKAHEHCGMYPPGKRLTQWVKDQLGMTE